MNRQERMAALEVENAELRAKNEGLARKYLEVSEERDAIVREQRRFSCHIGAINEVLREIILTALKAE